MGMRQMNSGVIAGFSALIFAALLAVPAASAEDLTTDVMSNAAKTPVTVSVPVRTVPAPGTSGQNGIIELSVGGADPIAVMLDTGSVGLRVWGGSRSEVAITNKRVSSVIGGTKVPGLLGTAPLSIGGVRTTVDVPIQIINVNSPYIQRWKQLGVAGVLGIGVSSGQLTNPLVALPGDLGLRWSVHFTRDTSDRSGRVGALKLGALPPTNADMHFRLPYQGINVNGARLWDDHAANGCWTFAAAREYCVPTWFDSGLSAMRIKGREFSSVPQTARGQLRPGTRVSLAAGSSSFKGDTLVAGNTYSKNFARVFASGKPEINTGNSYYFEYTVTYNVATGDLYLSKPPRKRK